MTTLKMKMRGFIARLSTGRLPKNQREVVPGPREDFTPLAASSPATSSRGWRIPYHHRDPTVLRTQRRGSKQGVDGRQANEDARLDAQRRNQDFMRANTSELQPLEMEGDSGRAPRPTPTGIAKQIVAKHIADLAAAQEAMIKEQGLSMRRASSSSDASPVNLEDAQAAPLEGFCRYSVYHYAPEESSEGSADVVDTEDWNMESLMEVGESQADYSPLRQGMVASWPTLPMCEVY